VFPIPFYPRVRQLGKILQGIFHIPFSSFLPLLAYSFLYASALPTGASRFAAVAK